MAIPVYKFAIREDLKKQSEFSFLPSRAHSDDTGWDVRAAFENGVKSIIVKPGEYVKIPLGIRALCPSGYWLKLSPRSSTFAKKQLHALYGTIDQNYEGSICFAAQYLPELNITTEVSVNTESYYDELFDELRYETSANSYINSDNLVINFGDAIGQLIPIKRQEMIPEEVSNEEYDNLCKARNASRGIGGFGSSGK